MASSLALPSHEEPTLVTKLPPQDASCKYHHLELGFQYAYLEGAPTSSPLQTLQLVNPLMIICQTLLYEEGACNVTILAFTAEGMVNRAAHTDESRCCPSCDISFRP